MPIAGFFRGEVTAADPRFWVSDTRNQLRASAHQRLDLRIDKAWYRRRSRLTAYAEVVNVLNHSQHRYCPFDQVPFTSAFGCLDRQRMLPILPAAGLTIEKRGEQERRLRELELGANRLQLKALRAQVNPHFLFNALNTVAGLIPRHPERAEQTIEQLAGVFRFTLRRMDREWVRVEEEMEAVHAYLDVEQARFGERLSFHMALAPAAAALRIPAMVIQTLVENAVKHGISTQSTPGRLEIGAALEGVRIAIEVRESGPGFTAFAPPRGEDGGHGLPNIRERPRRLFRSRGRAHHQPRHRPRHDPGASGNAVPERPGRRSARMIRILLVDDEEFARERLRQLLSPLPDVDVVGEAADTFERFAVPGDAPAASLDDWRLPAAPHSSGPVLLRPSAIRAGAIP